MSVSGCKALVDVLVARQEGLMGPSSISDGAISNAPSNVQQSSHPAVTHGDIAFVVGSDVHHKRTRSEPSRLVAIAMMLGFVNNNAFPTPPAMSTLACKLALHDMRAGMLRVSGLPLILVGGPVSMSTLESLRPDVEGQISSRNLQENQTGFELVFFYGLQEEALMDAVLKCIRLLGKALTEVDVRGAGMGDFRATEIAGLFAEGIMSGLARMDVSSNGLTDAGIVAILSAIMVSPPPRLQMLDLSNNQACDRGAAALTDLIKARAAQTTDPQPSLSHQAGSSHVASVNDSTLACTGAQVSEIFPVLRAAMLETPSKASPRSLLSGIFRTYKPYNALQQNPPCCLTVASPMLNIRFYGNHYPFSLEALRDLHTALHESQQLPCGGPVRLDMLHLAPSLRPPQTPDGALLPGGSGTQSSPRTIMAEPEKETLQRRSFPGYSLVTNRFRHGATFCPAVENDQAQTAIAATENKNCTTHHTRNVSHVTDSSDPDCGCGVCYSAPNHLLVMPCNHKLCIQCYRRLVGPESFKKGAICPFCRTAIEGFEYRSWPPVKS